MRYFRLSSQSISPYTGERYGLFVAVWHLIRDHRVTLEEESTYWEHRTWYEANLPIPPFYSDGNPLRAITWFKDHMRKDPMLNRLNFYRDLAIRYNLFIGLEFTDLPGNVIYEDNFQIAAFRQQSQ